MSLKSKLRKIFVEECSGDPTTARGFSGFPIRMVQKEVTVGEAAIHDDREMADGRPAYAWWNEIQMLRQQVRELENRDVNFLNKMALLRIAEWAFAKEPISGDTIIRFRAIVSMNETEEILRHPEKFCTIESKGLDPNQEKENGDEN